MSLSNDRGKPNKFMSGKVIMTDGIRSMKLTDLEGAGHDPSWNRNVEQEYMERVRRRASDRAREVLRSAKREAEHLHEQARLEGYEAGLEQARQELEAHRDALSQTLGQAIMQFEQSGRAVWESHRQDIVALVLTAVEKITALELDERRAESLATLLERAVEQLESRIGLTVVVHPGDAEVIEDLMQRSRERFPQLSGWRVKADPAMSPGGLIVESENGMIDSSMEVRRAAVNEILDLLVVGRGDESVPNQGLYREPEQQVPTAETSEASVPENPENVASPGGFPQAPPEVPPAPAPHQAPLVEAWEDSAPEFSAPAGQQITADPADTVDPFEAAQAAMAEQEVSAVPETTSEADVVPGPEAEAAAETFAPEVPEPAPQVADEADTEPSDTEPEANVVDPFEAAQAAIASQEHGGVPEPEPERVNAGDDEPQATVPEKAAAENTELDPFEAAQAAMARQTDATPPNETDTPDGDR